MDATFAFAEQASLPVITIYNKKGSPQASCFVNAFAVSTDRRRMARPNGNAVEYTQAHALWYLSLLGDAGQGTTLQAIYGALTANSAAYSASIEGIGSVVLGNQDELLMNEGYSTHWNYRQEGFALPLPTTSGEKPVMLRGSHGILEPRQLTVANPMRAAMETRHKGSRSKKKGKQRVKALADDATLSTGGSDANDPETRQKAADLPFFVVLVPGHETNKRRAREQLFSSFLGMRLPFPFKESWVSALWEQAEQAKQIEQLLVWSYGLPWPGDETRINDLPAGFTPIMHDGYLCYPSPKLLQQTVQELIAGPVVVEEEPEFALA